MLHTTVTSSMLYVLNTVLVGNMLQAVRNKADVTFPVLLRLMIWMNVWNSNICRCGCFFWSMELNATQANIKKQYPDFDSCGSLLRREADADSLGGVSHLLTVASCPLISLISLENCRQIVYKSTSKETHCFPSHFAKWMCDRAAISVNSD